MEGAAAAARSQTTKLPRIDVHTGSVGRRQTVPSTSVGLSGPSYSISGIAEKFRLPPASVLQPGIEQQPGELDSWPVHSIRPAPSNLSLGQSTTSKFSRLPQSHPSPARGMMAISKPKFLEQLEGYLQKELRLLGCPSTGPHELRLQAHREVFEYLIEDFKTYKPLLSAIKNEYELFIGHQQDVIKELEPMRAQLETVQEECERKIMALREEEKSEEAGVQRENKRLRTVIEKMRTDELSYKAQIKRLQSEVAGLYEKYREEADARKLLVADYNDLKFRQQEQKGEEGGQEEREDPVILKLKLARAREDLRAAHLRINTMLADYGDVVPRREFEMLETGFKNLEAELEALKNDHTTLMEEHSTLQSIYKDVLSQRDRLSDETSRLKRSATPRPDWERCAAYIEGGAEVWAGLAEGRSSDQLVDVLLAQIAGVDVSEIANEDTFQGQGLGEEVPRYLRAEGAVRNRRIGRKEVNELITGFWKHRITSQGPPLPLDESLFSFLLSRHDSNEPLALEDGYNLQEACSRFAHEPHIHLFDQIISGAVREEVFHRWLQTQTSLTEALNKQQQEEGLISQAALEQVLSRHFPAKPPAHLKALVTMATHLASPKPGVVNFIALLSPDSEGQPSQFALLLLEQSQQERKQFVAELTEALGNKSEVTLGEVQAVLQSLDPSKPVGELHSVLARGFSVAVEAVAEAGEVSVALSKLTERLNRGDLQRSGPKPS